MFKSFWDFGALKYLDWKKYLTTFLKGGKDFKRNDFWRIGAGNYVKDYQIRVHEKNVLAICVLFFLCFDKLHCVLLYWETEIIS